MGDGFFAESGNDLFLVDLSGRSRVICRKPFGFWEPCSSPDGRSLALGVFTWALNACLLEWR